MTDAKKTRTVKVDYLARVEGEGALYIKYNGASIEDVKLKIFEPPRFFEAFLQKRHWLEAPDITARICGICPIAYQMSAVHALEALVGYRAEGMIRELRRLLYCGEWIESHGIHMFMLHLPDFLGFPDSIAMAKHAPDKVKAALQIKKAGNEIVRLVGGREIHPINVRVGGFYRLPNEKDLQHLAQHILKPARDMLETLLYWMAGFHYPQLERQYHFVSLRHPCEYPLNEGRIISNRGLDLDMQDYEKYFVEEHIPYSNALHSKTLADGQAYLVGPMARFNLCYDLLPGNIQSLTETLQLKPPVLNPFKSLLIRGIELFYAFEEAIRICHHYRKPDRAFEDLSPQAGESCWATEAPRGLLFHRYRINAQGLIEEAKIVAPTSQNQKSIEEDLRDLIPLYAHLSDQQLTHLCEQSIRNYDPCISCATHFLKVTFEGRP